MAAWSLFTFCKFLIFLTTGLCVLGYEERRTMFRTVGVGQFNNVGSLRVFEVLVPPSTLAMNWTLEADRSPAKCLQTDITLYFQLGSIPVTQYQSNLTFPAQFTISRSYLRGPDFIPSNKSAVVLEFPRPVAGHWFAAAYVDDTRNQVIKTITNVDCRFTLRVNVTVWIEDAISEIDVGRRANLSLTTAMSLFRFYMPGSVYAATLTLDCDPAPRCDAMLSWRGAGLPDQAQEGTALVQCEEIGSPVCLLNMSSPLVDQWHYVEIHRSSNESQSVGLRVDVEVCSGASGVKTTRVSSLPSFDLMSSDPNISSDMSASDLSSAITRLDESLEHSWTEIVIATNDDDENPNPMEQSPVAIISVLNPGATKGSCGARVIPLFRTNSEDNPMYTTFSADPNSATTVFIIDGDDVVTMRFDVDEFRDIGSTLKIRVGMPVFDMGNSSSGLNVTVRVCVQRGRLPVEGSGGGALRCFPGEEEMNLTREQDGDQRLYPFPESGPWFIGVQRECYNLTDRESCGDQDLTAVLLQVYTSPCADGCSNVASCARYSASIYTYAACSCIAGYRGFTCEDDSAASSLSIQFLYSMLLCVSNLAFLPAIVVAAMRRRYPEMVVYIANMFFSSFYHACDMSTWSQYRLCIMPYHVLSFCDFFCSLMSFWVTLLAMSLLWPWVVHVGHMVGVFALSMAVKWNAHGTITNVVPIAVGCAVVIVSWITQSVLKKTFVPGKRAFLLVLPGLTLAVLGVCLFAFVETDTNYPYTHSAWHVCMSFSIVFLLPTKRVTLIKATSSRESSSSFNLVDYTEELYSDAPSA